MNLGRLGESKAAAYIKNKGYTLIQQNFYTDIGEIDIIATIDDVLVFIEVKTRVGIAAGMPYEAVTKKKLATIRRVGLLYLRKTKLYYRFLRIDVVSIVLDYSYNVVTLDHFENVDL